MSSASGSCSPPRTTTGAGPARSGASIPSNWRRTPSSRTTTTPLPSTRAAIPASSSRAGLPSRQPAPLARAESRSVSLVDSSVKALIGRRGYPAPPSGPGGVQQLQQVVGDQLDLLVPPLGRPVVAGDDPHPVHPAEVAVHERVAGLGLLVRAVGEREVPGAVLGPRVPREVGVLVLGAGLDPPPLAAQHVPPGRDQLPRVGDAGLVDEVLRHGPSPAAAAAPRRPGSRRTPPATSHGPA